jgi:hypothetical protein
MFFSSWDSLKLLYMYKSLSESQLEKNIYKSLSESQLEKTYTRA